MRIFLFISFYLIFGNLLIAQTPSVQWGSANEKPKKSYIEKIIGKDEQFLFVLRYKDGGWFGKDKFLLEKFDQKTLQLVGTDELFIPLLNGNLPEYEDLYYQNGIFMLFVSQTYPATKNKITFGLQTNVLSPTIVSYQYIPLDTIASLSRKSSDEINIMRAPAGNHFLIYHNDNFQQYQNEYLNFKVYDSQLKIDYSKKIMLPYKDKSFFISNYLINDLGDVYLLAKVVDEERIWKKGRPNFIYAVVNMNREDAEYKKFDVNLGNRSISDIDFKIAQNGDLVVAGFYSNRARTEEEMGGLFYFRIEKTAKQINGKIVRDFDSNFLSLFMRDRNVSRGGELFDYNIDYMLTDTIGNTYMLAEQYYMDQICRTDFRTGIQTCTYYYNYNDIIAIKIDKEGNIIWTKKIPKRQVTVNDGGPFSSYIAFLDNNRLHCIYNDSHRNNNLRQGDRMYTMSNPKKSIVVDIVMDENGLMKRNYLFSARDRSIIIRPKLNKLISADEHIIYGQSSSKYLLGRILFNR